MVFSSTIFLFLFLPVVLIIHYFLPRAWRNVFLLGASFLFYAFGEVIYSLVMVVSIVMNYAFAGAMARRRGLPSEKKWLIGAIVLNLALLAVFKYADFMVLNLNVLLKLFGVAPLHPPGLHLPIGISFFTFQAIAYVVDVYRGAVPAARSVVDVGLNFSFFPHLIAGPIVRYIVIARDLHQRVISDADVRAGIRRFIIGLAKKVLLANPLGAMADSAFAAPLSQMSAGMAWFGAACYALQIFFDFSGYSDMAIGLGRVFGFHFLENFNYPYVAKSITDFWRRWHMSLSTWFRDYLYIPLGGNRCSPARTYGNLFIVFFLCGLWHGASWTFVLWGLYQGVFLVLERAGKDFFRIRIPAVIGHLYAGVVVIFGWVLFRAEDLPHAGRYLSAMFGLNGAASAAEATFWQNTGAMGITLAAVGVIFSMPVGPRLRRRFARASRRVGSEALRYVLGPCLAGSDVAMHLALVLLCVARLATGSYNPFIYFRF